MKGGYEAPRCEITRLSTVDCLNGSPARTFSNGEDDITNWKWNW